MALQITALSPRQLQSIYFQVPGAVSNGTGKSTVASRLTLTAEDCHEIAMHVDELVKQLPTVLQDFVRDSAKILTTTLANDWPERHIRERYELQAFRERLELRWRKGLDPLRMLLTCSREVCETFGKSHAKSKARKGLVRREVLLLLHMRACQTTMEILTLLENGLADGALARWRTLYEIEVIASLINTHGDELAQRYLDHEAVAMKRSMDNELKFTDPASGPPVPKRQQKEIEKDFDATIARYGREFGSPYGWAAHQIGLKKPTFQDLEKAAHIEPLPPPYKRASFKVHAGVAGLLHNLGNMSESIATLSGASNAGLEEPAIQTAYSLTHITSLLYGKTRRIWRTIELAALCNLRDQVLVECNKATRRLERDEREAADA